MFYKIIPFLVDEIAKNGCFCPKISKIWQYTEVILPDTNVVKYNSSVLGFYLQTTYQRVSGHQKFTYPARKFTYPNWNSILLLI